MVSPKQSYATGLVVSAVTGILVFASVWWIIAYANFSYLSDVLGPVAGIILGGIASIAMFFPGRRFDVPLNWVGIELFLGKPTERIYENGRHWIPPLFGLRICPAREKKFIVKMPGTKINAQDGITLFFGVDEPLHPDQHNRLQYSVVDPIRYIAVDDPEDSLREEFLEKARLFFGQIAKAIGVKNIQLLFDTFIQLPSGTAPDHSFKDQLTGARFVMTGQNDDRINGPQDQTNDQRIFSDPSVTAIMTHAGEFMQIVGTWGLGEITAFTPNVRVNPEAEQSAAQKQAEIENMAGLQTKVRKVRELTKEMTDDAKVNPDLALTTIAAMSGQQGMTVENKTVNISGLPEVARALGEKLIDVLKSKEKE